jgi:hypothetical protein
MIPTKNENPKGLHHRYKIQKFERQEVYYNRRWIDVTLFEGEFEVPDDCRRRFVYKDVDEKAEYFVLRLDEGGSDLKHIAACRIAIHAYADAIEPHIPQLAKDLKERYPLLNSTQNPEVSDTTKAK